MSRSEIYISSFVVKEKYSSKDSSLYDLNEKIVVEEKEYKNMLNVIKMFCYEYEEYFDNDNKIFSIDQSTIVLQEEKNYDYLSFVIKCGSYGLKGSIIDKKTRKINYIMSENDANVKSFNCMLYVPKVINEKIYKGLIMFQSLDNYGVKTITTRYLGGFLSKHGLIINVRSLSTESIVKKIIEQNKLARILFIKNNISPDSSDNLIISGGKEEKTYYAPKMSTKLIERLVFLLKNKGQDSVLEIDNNNYDQIKITFKLYNRTHTVNIGDIDKFSIREDVPDNIFNNGNCNNSEIVNYMIKLTEDYKKDIIFTGGDYD